MQVRMDHGLKAYTYTPNDDRGFVGKLFDSLPVPRTAQNYQVHVFIEFTDEEEHTVIDQIDYDRVAIEEATADQIRHLTVSSRLPWSDSGLKNAAREYREQRIASTCHTASE